MRMIFCRLLFLILALSLLSCSFGAKGEMVAQNFEFASSQLKTAVEATEAAKKNESQTDRDRREKRGYGPLVSPRSVNADGSLFLVSSRDWCSGFFPGTLWYMYEYTKDTEWQRLAREYSAPLEVEKSNGTTHDMGFKVYCSFGNGFRLTKDAAYRAILLQSAYTLADRYEPTIGAIRSWDHSRNRWECPVIIDNMMNLELLFWAFRESGDSLFYDVAVDHATTTLKNHFREDYSCYHVVDYDVVSGEILKKTTHQGYANESAWSRGQAWALYGYTMCYRESGRVEFLEQAEHIAEYIFTHPNLPRDLIPYWDYDAPQIPNEPRDVSAATVTASALYELSLYDPINGEQYRAWASTILDNLSRDYLVERGEMHGFLLNNSTGSKPGEFEVDVPLSYADYYFLEALLRRDKTEKGESIF